MKKSANDLLTGARRNPTPVQSDNTRVVVRRPTQSTIGPAPSVPSRITPQSGGAARLVATEAARLNPIVDAVAGAFDAGRDVRAGNFGMAALSAMSMVPGIPSTRKAIGLAPGGEPYRSIMNRAGEVITQLDFPEGTNHVKLATAWARSRFPVETGNRAGLEAVIRREFGEGKASMQGFLNPETGDRFLPGTGVRIPVAIKPSATELRYFESTLANPAELRELQEKVPSFRLQDGQIFVDRTDLRTLNDYVMETSRLGRGQGTNIPRTFTSGSFSRKLYK